MTDRNVRNLSRLEAKGSSSRLLNLHRIALEYGATAEWGDQPMFSDRRLNRALIIKHRLRRDELQNFRHRRFVATKVVLPIDPRALGVGGRFMFVGQANFYRTLATNFGLNREDEDTRRLELLDRLPAFDPFLMREYLRTNGAIVAPCYFNISKGDLNGITEFVKSEVESLVNLSIGGGVDTKSGNPVARMTSIILSTKLGSDLALLGQTFRLEPEQYREGVFCWKGFLYYKWMNARTMSGVREVTEGVRTIRPRGLVDTSVAVELDRSRERICEQILQACDDAGRMIAAYDRAYEALVVGGRPEQFRDFLLAAPRLFARLGERLGAIEHITSFWSYRFGHGHATPDAAELLDIFSDFETSLGVPETRRTNSSEPAVAA